MDIIFKAADIQVEWEPTIKQVLEEYIPQLNLSLGSLTRITVTDNFFEEVLAFQERHNKKIKGATKTSTSVAVAKVLDYTNKQGEYKQEIFLSSFIALGLLSQDANDRQKAFHFIHHELVHIHDGYIRNQIYTDDEVRGVGAHMLTHKLRVHSDIIWSEYIAERLSYNTGTPDSIHRFLSHLLGVIADVKKSIKEKIDSYRYDGNIDLLMKVLEEETSMMLKLSGNLAGVLQGCLSISDSYQKVMDVVDELLEATFLSSTWLLLKEELAYLYDLYPNWSEISVLDSMGTIVLTCWNELGVFPEVNGEQMYVSIP